MQRFFSIGINPVRLISIVCLVAGVLFSGCGGNGGGSGNGGILPPPPTSSGSSTPVAVARVYPQVGDAPFRTWLISNESYDPNGTIVKYEWDTDGDGSFDVTQHSPAAYEITYSEGVYRAVLKVTDSDGNTAVSSTPPIFSTSSSVNWSFTYIAGGPDHEFESNVIPSIALEPNSQLPYFIYPSERGKAEGTFPVNFGWLSASGTIGSEPCPEELVPADIGGTINSELVFDASGQAYFAALAEGTEKEYSSDLWVASKSADGAWASTLVDGEGYENGRSPHLVSSPSGKMWLLYYYGASEYAVPQDDMRVATFSDEQWQVSTLYSYAPDLTAPIKDASVGGNDMPVFLFGYYVGELLPGGVHSIPVAAGYNGFQPQAIGVNSDGVAEVIGETGRNLYRPKYGLAYANESDGFTIHTIIESEEGFNPYKALYWQSNRIVLFRSYDADQVVMIWERNGTWKAEIIPRIGNDDLGYVDSVIDDQGRLYALLKDSHYDYGKLYLGVRDPRW